MSEALEHEQLCSYLRATYPEVIFISDASGLKLPIGQATRWARLKSHRGVPDLIILEPRRNSHGLCIELKRTGEKIMKKDGSLKTVHLQEQHDLLTTLRKKGYVANFALGFEEAQQMIDTYLTV